MAKIRRMTYTKDNGEVSERVVMVVAEPRKNYLCLDISDFSLEDVDFLEQSFKDAEARKDELLGEFEDETGHRIDKLWRSFKPGGIDWKE